MEWHSGSPSDTLKIGQMLGQKLIPGDVVCLFGDLGAGKTTLVKGILDGAQGKEHPHTLTSPTFTYLNIYPGTPTFYHFDLYRLRDADEFLSMGFEEFLAANGICCLEWSEKIQPLIPEEAVRVTIQHAGGDQRTIYVL